MNIAYYPSPVGLIEIKADENALVGLNFRDKEEISVNPTHPVIQQTINQLVEYFEGKRHSFDVPLNFLEGTEFQQKVWNALLQIPYGKTISYALLAKNINNPKACRAVGSANGKNPISIIVPCHRVIAADGNLGGYASGLERKKQLLDLESQLF
jgi:methylated-DNA-[protein]-cysteine S-methyltransferase